jgi:uncharacterized protein YdaL
VYYDGDDNAADFRIGERSAIMVRNLLGHFAEVDVFMTPLARYPNAPLSECDRAVYMGTYFDANMPAVFLHDVARYGKPLLWMNYNIWKLEQAMGGRRFRAAWGFAYQKVEGQLPDFYSTFTYKGATFRKVVEQGSDGKPVAHPEIVLLRNDSAQVLAEGIHSTTKARTPYALRKGDHFYIADNPVSVIDERDRYLILADLLFDFLKLEPRSRKRHALVRLEDVHPGYDPQLLNAAIEVFRKRKVPFAISLIPRYLVPGKALETTEDARFLELIRHALENGGSILVHGYEHQLPLDLGCGLSFTGEGYEFWDICKSAALPFDSVRFVQQRVDRAKKILHDAKLPHVGWVTPHYAASPLAIRVIHGNFGRVVQRMKYFPEGKPLTQANAIDQFFPYTIAHDYYGVHVWPENMGYVPLPRVGGKPQHVEQMLEIARLNKVVRDGWASFFWHPVIARTELGLRSLERLVDGVRAEGYEFVSLDELRKRGE